MKDVFLSAAAEAIIPALLLTEALIIAKRSPIDLAVERFFAPDGTFPLRTAQRCFLP